MYLGIDLGTSAIKFILLDEAQNIIAEHSQSLSVANPQPLWSEQNPADWWQATTIGMGYLQKEYPAALRSLKAIGLSGQQHGAVLLDSHNAVLRPAILWNDNRAFTECEVLKKEVPHYADLIGNQIMPGFTAPKIVWVAKHEPHLFNQLKTVLLPKDYLRFKMTGELATDLSDASGTAWLNVKERRWSDEMLQATGLTQKNMPKLYEGSEITGTVTADMASTLGIPANTQVIAGAGDNPAAAISMNVIAQGSAFLSLGTSGVYFVSMDDYKANPGEGLHTFCHALPARWHVMSVHLSAASSLAWFANICQATVKDLLTEAEQQANDRPSPFFLPYLTGERTPHINPHATGLFFGLTQTTQRADLTRAILEGVALAFADGQDVMQHAGINIGEVSVVGGGAQSAYWGKILASTLNRPLVYRKNREMGAALGAARLAWLGTQGGNPESVFTLPPIEQIIEPNAELSKRYQEKRLVFKKLYTQNCDLFQMSRIP